MQPDIKWLDQPDVFRVNRLDAHSDHEHFASESDYAEGRHALVQSLNGTWKFRWSVNAKVRPQDFYKEDFDHSDFDDIAVPGHIEMAGYDRIHYINTMYPWEGHLFRRPAHSIAGDCEGQFSEADYNPVGSYVCRFDLDEALRGKRVIVRFEGVEQAMYVYLNGQFIGYAEDSFTPSEFDLTDAIRDTDNILAVEVHKRSTAAYLEDQDFFRFSGIFRPVSLIALPKLHVQDMFLRTNVNLDDKSAYVDLKLKFSNVAEGGKAWVSVLDNGKEIAKNLCEADGTQKVEIDMPAPVQLWSNKTPYMYTLKICVYDANDSLVEIVPWRFGFRRIELADGLIKLNGERHIINGVNRHEWNAHSGRCITEEDEHKDIECFRKNNINSVRTCHYPDRISWYSLCDENGIYMMAETNLESHGSWMKQGAVEPSWNVPGSLPKWEGAVMDRAISNFEWFKNHTAVLFWSLGNESYAGEVLEKMNAFYKENDPDRLVHYEGVFYTPERKDRISDMESRMYATPEEIREYLEKDASKPFVLCEYMHDMGNSLGGMGSYIKLIDEYPKYQGGYIWDFIDQALFVKDEITGEEVLRYGGDFDDRPSDYEFSGNGIVFADRTEKPAMQEVRYYYGLHE